jgi:predicted DNA-binding transcriptional regulator YafY
VNIRGGQGSTAAQVRQVQNQLNRLKVLYPDDLCSDGGRPQNWRWKSGSPVGLKFLTADMAIALSLVMRYMQQLMPASTLAALNPLLAHSATVLNQAEKDWLSKLLIKHAWPERNPPKIIELVQEQVYEALKRETSLLKISYQSRADAQPEKRLIWPLGLMMKNDLLYLVALKIDEKSGNASGERWYALHRITAAKIQAAKTASGRPDLSLAEKNAKGWFSNPGGEIQSEMIRMVFRVDEIASVNLIESPLCGMQGAAEILADGWRRITVDILITEDLITWLRGYGSHAVVEQPPLLVERMKTEAAAMWANYS